VLEGLEATGGDGTGSDNAPPPSESAGSSGRTIPSTVAPPSGRRSRRGRHGRRWSPGGSLAYCGHGRSVGFTFPAGAH